MCRPIKGRIAGAILNFMIKTYLNVRVTVFNYENKLLIVKIRLVSTVALVYWVARATAV